MDTKSGSPAVMVAVEVDVNNACSQEGEAEV